MLRGQSWGQVRLWPRGVDLLHFSPSKRCLATRASWGVGDAPRQNLANEAKPLPLGEHHTGRKVSMSLTPPATPLVLPIDGTAPSAQPIGLPERAVVLYVGRMSMLPALPQRYHY